MEGLVSSFSLVLGTFRICASLIHIHTNTSTKTEPYKHKLFIRGIQVYVKVKPLTSSKNMIKWGEFKRYFDESFSQNKKIDQS